MLLALQSKSILNIWRAVSKPISTNTYVCQIAADGQAVIVDPGMDVHIADKIIEENNLKPTHVLCTHGHFDHIAGAKYFQTKYSALVYMSKKDMVVAGRSNFLLKAMKFNGKIVLPKFDVLVEGRTIIDIGGASWEMIPCPGHTAGSVVIKASETLFTGDSLYKTGVSLSRLPEANLGQLKVSLCNLIASQDLASQVLPGHGEHGQLGHILDENEKLKELLTVSE